jgi:hypothetical protein
VRDAVTGDVLGWAGRLCNEAERLGLYVEVTVSGGGLRFIGSSSSSYAELHRKFTLDRHTGAGIELYRNCARYITISGLQQGSCDAFGSIDQFLDEQAARGGMPVVIDFNAAGPDYYEDLIRNGAPEGERSEKFQEVVWHLAGAGWSTERIADELEKHPGGIGAKYAGRLLAEVARSFGKWQSYRRTSAVGGGASGGAPWPQIEIRPGELPRVVNEAEDALLLLGREIYQRGGLMVRPVFNKSLKASDGRETGGWQLIPLSRIHLVEALCCAAQFLRYDLRRKRWTAVDAPNRIAEPIWHGKAAGGCRT